mgnify:CR=1 FL=1
MSSRSSTLPLIVPILVSVSVTRALTASTLPSTASIASVLSEINSRISVSAVFKSATSFTRPLLASPTVVPKAVILPSAVSRRPSKPVIAAAFSPIEVV